MSNNSSDGGEVSGQRCEPFDRRLSMTEVSADTSIGEVAEVPRRRVCRLIGGRRHGSPKRVKKPAMSTVAKLLLSFATMASAACPVAAASIHAVSHRPSVGFKSRRARRAAGQRNVVN